MKKTRTLLTILCLIVSFTAPITACAKDSSYAENSIEAQILKGINAERKAEGLEPLKQDVDMDEAADLRASEAQKKWSHTRPNGEEYWTAEPDLIYGENLAKGYKRVNDIIDAWVKSPTHRENILYDFKTCAIGVVIQSNGTYCVALEFGY